MKDWNRWTRPIATILFWTALGILFALPNLPSVDWSRILLGSLAQWWSWGFVAPLISSIDKRLPFQENQLGLRLLVHLPASVVTTSFYAYFFSAMRALLGLASWHVVTNRGFLAAAFRGGILWSWVVYWVILGVIQTFRYYDRYLAGELRLERMERNLSEARLNALRTQLDPHFLFNALNTISSQVERDPRLARTMIENLGDLLRMSLDARDRQEIPLAEEIAFLDHYVAIQKIRFAENLQIEIQVALEVKYALVPCLILQPLVENSIRHGISPRASGGTVIVTAGRDTDRLKIGVADNGVGLPTGWTFDGSAGTGLSVTRERIFGLHPDQESHFFVRPREGGGTEVEISLPLRFAEEQTNGSIG